MTSARFLSAANGCPLLFYDLGLLLYAFFNGFCKLRRTLFFWRITPQKSTQLAGLLSGVPGHVLNNFFVIQTGLNA